MVTLVERLAPVSQKVHYSSRFIRIISSSKNKVDHLDDCMGAGRTRYSELVGINVLFDVIEESIDRATSIQEKPLIGFGKEFG